MYIRSNEGRSDLDVDLGHETFTRENESDGRRGRLLSHKMLSSKYRGTSLPPKEVVGSSTSLLWRGFVKGF